jgi:hypothetical protein
MYLIGASNIQRQQSANERIGWTARNAPSPPPPPRGSVSLRSCSGPGRRDSREGIRSASIVYSSNPVPARPLSTARSARGERGRRRRRQRAAGVVVGGGTMRHFRGTAAALHGVPHPARSAAAPPTAVAVRRGAQRRCLPASPPTGRPPSTSAATARPANVHPPCRARRLLLRLLLRRRRRRRQRGLTRPRRARARGRGEGRRGGTRSRRRGRRRRPPPRWAQPTPSSTSPCARARASPPAPARPPGPPGQRSHRRPQGMGEAPPPSP